MMSHSNRQDDDSRDYRRDSKPNKLLENKKKEEVFLNEVIDQQITALQQQLEKKDSEIKRFQTKFHGLEIKLEKKEEIIE